MKGFGSRAGVARRQRQAERASVLMSASLVTMSAYQYPELLNISQTGAKLRGISLPAKGVTALFRIGGLQVLCRVVWANEAQCGVRFDEPITPRSLKQIQLDGAVELERLSPSEQEAKDDWIEGNVD
jgi:hypothetical protein